MSAPTLTADIPYTVIDVPVVSPVPQDEIDETSVTSDAETQRASELLEELDAEEARFRIAQLGLNNFLYNAVLLFLPYFYSSRVYPVLRSATLTEEEIKFQFTEAASKGTFKLKHWPDVKKSWNELLDSLSNEWKTLNVVSVLLLTAIYNVLQLGGKGNGLTQCTAFMSLFSALMSLLFGCLYLIRFETMRRTYKAIQWSSDALKTSHTVLWNIYILLALPSVWLAWSLILFVVCLMSIVWQPTDKTIGSTSGLGPLHPATKISVSALLFVGMAHLSLALLTFSHYGSRMDKTWSKKLESFRGAIQLADSVTFNMPPYAHLPLSYFWHYSTSRPFNNSMPGPPYHYSQYSSYWPYSIYRPFDNSRPAPSYPHSQYLPYPPHFNNTGPFNYGRPHNDSTSLNYGRSLNDSRSLNYGRSLNDSRSLNYGRPLDDSRSLNYGRPLNNSRPLNDSRPVSNSGPIDNSRPFNFTISNSDSTIRPVRITRTPSVPSS